MLKTKEICRELENVRAKVSEVSPPPVLKLRCYNDATGRAIALHDMIGGEGQMPDVIRKHWAKSGVCCEVVENNYNWTNPRGSW